VGYEKIKHICSLTNLSKYKLLQPRAVFEYFNKEMPTTIQRVKVQLGQIMKGGNGILLIICKKKTKG
jgi:hypothetical protein